MSSSDANGYADGVLEFQVDAGAGNPPTTTRATWNFDFSIATGLNGVGGAIAKDGITRISVGWSIALATWTHVAMTVNPGGNVQLWVDGIMRDTKAGAPNTLIADPAASPRLGCRHDGTQPFEGIADDVRVYGRVLTDDEIRALASLAL